MSQEAFMPLATARLAATTTSKRMTLPADGTHFRVFNEGATTAWVHFGQSGVTAVIPAADAHGPATPVAPGSVELFRRNPSSASPVTHVAVILGTGTGDVHVTVGEGQ